MQSGRIGNATTGAVSIPSKSEGSAAPTARRSPRASVDSSDRGALGALQRRTSSPHQSGPPHRSGSPASTSRQSPTDGSSTGSEVMWLAGLQAVATRHDSAEADQQLSAGLAAQEARAPAGESEIMESAGQALQDLRTVSRAEGRPARRIASNTDESISAVRQASPGPNAPRGEPDAPAPQKTDPDSDKNWKSRFKSKREIVKDAHVAKGGSRLVGGLKGVLGTAIPPGAMKAMGAVRSEYAAQKELGTPKPFSAIKALGALGLGGQPSAAQIQVRRRTVTAESAADFLAAKAARLSARRPDSMSVDSDEDPQGDEPANPAPTV
jgi:hypothetical protein